MINEIISEIKKIPNLTGNKKIKSFLVFNINKKEKDELYNTINKEFLEVYEKLDILRKKEMSELYELRKPIYEKYQELEKRYKNSQRLDYVRKLHSEFREDNDKMISESVTHSSDLRESYQFNELNLQKYIENEKRFIHLNETMDFTNLINFNQDNSNFHNFKLTEEEKEYETLQKYLNKYRFSQSLVVNSEIFEPKLDDFLNSIFSIQYLNWFFLTFEFSKKEFDKQSSGRTKYWIYSENTTIIEL